MITLLQITGEIALLAMIIYFAVLSWNKILEARIKMASDVYFAELFAKMLDNMVSGLDPEEFADDFWSKVSPETKQKIQAILWALILKIFGDI